MLLLGGRDTTQSTYTDRRSLLAALELQGPAWLTLPHRLKGEAALREAAEAGHEGVVCRRLGSPYKSGSRSRCSLKIKFPWHLAYRRVQKMHTAGAE